MTEETSRFKAPFIAAAQAQKHVTHNEGLAIFDAVVGAVALARVAAPIGGEVDGDGYIVTTGTGDFAAWDGSFAFRLDGQWRRVLPAAGMRVWVTDEQALYVFYDGAWLPLAEPIVFPATAMVHIDPAGDDDTADGSLALPFETVDAASAFASFTLQRRRILLSAAAGDYTGQTAILVAVAGQTIGFAGAGAVPADVAGIAFSCSGAGEIQIENAETASIVAFGDARVRLWDMGYVTNAGVAHVQASDNVRLDVGFGETLTGNFDRHLYAADNAAIKWAPDALTLVGTPAIGNEFATAATGGKVFSSWFGSPTGSATGKRARAEALSLVYVYGNAFPGSTAGDADAIGSYNGT